MNMSRSTGTTSLAGRKSEVQSWMWESDDFDEIFAEDDGRRTRWLSTPSTTVRLSAPGLWCISWGRRTPGSLGRLNNKQLKSETARLQNDLRPLMIGRISQQSTNYIKGSSRLVTGDWVLLHTLSILQCVYIFSHHTSDTKHKNGFQDNNYKSITKFKIPYFSTDWLT